LIQAAKGNRHSARDSAMILVGAGIAAKMPFKVHPHMLRHATGYALANKGTDTIPRMHSVRDRPAPRDAPDKRRRTYPD
jgi:site-specific recombinase XerD